MTYPDQWFLDCGPWNPSFNWNIKATFFLLFWFQKILAVAWKEGSFHRAREKECTLCSRFFTSTLPALLPLNSLPLIPFPVPHRMADIMQVTRLEWCPPQNHSSTSRLLSSQTACLHLFGKCSAFTKQNFDGACKQNSQFSIAIIIITKLLAYSCWHW